MLGEREGGRGRGREGGREGGREREREGGREGERGRGRCVCGRKSHRESVVHIKD